MPNDLLTTSLLDLWSALGQTAQRVLLGGGYGLYLKQQHLTQARVATLINVDLWPVARVTQDLDLLLTAELVGNVDDMTTVRSALDRLAYEVIEGSKYLQFVRNVTDTRIVKIDLLTAQLDVLASSPAITADDRRARPSAKNRPDLHAHPTDGAIGLAESTISLDVSGTLSNGAAAQARIRLPHPFSYLMMKLTAYRDRKNDPAKDLGQHHALDVFRIMAMLTQAEMAEVTKQVAQHQSNPQMQSCRQVAELDFASESSAGVLAMRRHELWRNDDQLDVFLGAIREVFPS